ncbi:TetR/AcrR family transcriptional regulator [Streptomyces sp. BRB081]|uniref:TetR/AcrR family transcriptional regulator n=1 Tax=Streptomyces sp. BRB081 TaxID=2769544 RepID=UPI0018ACE9C1|nr:TetR/AcrR family transcriptional regulator [Streptomyces sp. BRB081]MBL3803293.1 TetR/AcrR family transcriptional regulator [Streptomyces sp. BRB081]
MAQARRRGRPRETGTDEAILDAARDLLLREGYARLSMEKVAVAAGVGKPTVYRRWPSKAALVADVARRSSTAATPDGEIPEPRPGEVVRTLVSWFRSHAQSVTDPDNAALILALTAAAAASPQDAESLYLGSTREQHTTLVEFLRAGIATGELRADTDVDAVVGALIGSSLYLLLTGRTAEAPERAEGSVRALLDGIRSPEAGAPG